MIYLCNPVSDASVRYVLKVLKHPTATSRKRFRREADILSSLNKNIRIARIVDFWEVNEDSYIVMEYINGQNLKSLYNSCDFDEYSILLIAHEITRALQDIWNEFNIIHRDIKPENIMVDESSHIKLLDFGLSKQCCEEMDSSTNMITLPRASLGTPGYMSPEHFTNFKDMDFRSDIYSLGATLYFLLTGFEANSGETMVDYYNNTLACSPPPLESFQGRCSSGCANLIRRMMQAKAADRYDSYAELVSEIKVLLKKAAG
jgi:serine/threonine-protein kinase